MRKEPGGMTPEACDERVGEILKGKGGEAHDEPDQPEEPSE